MRKESVLPLFAHADRVSAGKSLAIEIVNAHGGLPTTGGTGRLLCGHWGPGFAATSILSRNDLIGKMYGVANHNVCSWVMYDSSCYSGYTPMGMDEAENQIMMTGIPTCSFASVVFRLEPAFVSVREESVSNTAIGLTDCDGGAGVGGSPRCLE